MQQVAFLFEGKSEWIASGWNASRTDFNSTRGCRRDVRGMWRHDADGPFLYKPSWWRRRNERIVDGPENPFRWCFFAIFFSTVLTCNYHVDLDLTQSLCVIIAKSCLIFIKIFCQLSNYRWKIIFIL